MRKFKKFRQVSKDIFKLAIENVPLHVIFTDVDGKIMYANKFVEFITGYSHDEVIGSTPSLWGLQMDKKYYENMWNVIKIQKKIFESELTNRRKNGEKYIASVKIAPVIDKNVLVGFVGIEQDITILKEVDQMKSQFMSLSSHQLRTPLTAIRWNMELLLKGRSGELSAEQKATTEKIYKSVLEMVDLINGLLNITRIESNRLMVNSVKTDLKVLLNQILSEVEQQFANKKMIVKVSIDSNVPEINIDPNLLKHVYLNLLTNAYKYSAEGREISIRMYIKDEDVICEIKDSGYGIPEKEKSRIFERFYRAENILKLNAGGTGLGLYMVKILLKVMNGNIWFESKENEGSLFCFSLPLKGVDSQKGEVGLE